MVLSHCQCLLLYMDWRPPCRANDLNPTAGESSLWRVPLRDVRTPASGIWVCCDTA